MMNNEQKDPYNVTDIVPPFDITCNIKNLMLPTRDNIKLHTIVYFPPVHPPKCSVVLVRSPYTRTTYFGLPYEEALKHQAIYIQQACRGTGWSEGTFDPAQRDNEKNDAEDLFAWLTKQDWFNGRCAMFGASYPGWCQWSAQRAQFSGLVATTPRVAPMHSCVGAATDGGGVQLSFGINWMLSMHHRSTYGYEGVPDYNAMKTVWKLPVIDSDKHAGYSALAPFRHFFESANKPSIVLNSYQNEFKTFRAPALIAGGWFDNFKPETIESFLLMKKEAATKEARQFTRLHIGPWGHGGLLNPELFGKHCNQDALNEKQKKYIFNLLKNPTDDPLPNQPAVEFYMLGENCWHTADTWPPEKTIIKQAYIHSNGNANSSNGDGTINDTPPSQETPDVYISDPENPILSNHGQHQALGCYDRSDQEQRSSMLVFTSEKFTTPRTVTGEVQFEFFASVSTPDTDFFATLAEVTPEGHSYGLTTGMIRARFRNSMTSEELLIPGEIYKFKINLSHIAVKFLPGHALRLEIHGQNFPNLDRNANTGGPILQDEKLRLSRHTIYHSDKYPAFLSLPINNSF
ncbi:MAG: CocE/NonD family hydrolase [Lentisphaeria bacterium]